MLPVIPAHGSFFNTVPQLDYVSLLHAEEAFTTFINARAQAGAVKYLPVGMICTETRLGPTSARLSLPPSMWACSLLHMDRA